MEINEKNIIEELGFCTNELTLIVAELQPIEKDTPLTYEHLLELDNRYADAAAYF